VGTVSEPFYVLAPGRRLAASMAYWEQKAVVEVTYDEGDVLSSTSQGFEPIFGPHTVVDGVLVGTPEEPAEYVLHEIAGGTVALDLQPDPGGGPGSLNDLAVVMLAPEGT
jgi:hypothetical protein